MPVLVVYDSLVSVPLNLLFCADCLSIYCFPIPELVRILAL